MKKIYAPWRHKYVTQDLPGHKKNISADGCVFCNQFASDQDREYLILKRYRHCVTVVNHYPYNAGHLMVLPQAHKAELCLLTDEERNELFSAVTQSIEVLKKAMNPQGFNVGINMGSAGGGGIPCHMHVHILSRWNGDTNFLPLLSDTKVVCSDLFEVYDRLKPLFDEV